MTNASTDLHDLMFTFLDTAGAVERRFDRALAAVRGVSFSEYRLLLRLSQAPAATASRVDLARAVGQTPSAVTRALRPLEKTGYITTEKSLRDARQSLAKLTATGAALLDDARGLIDDMLTSSAWRRLGPDGQQTLHQRLLELQQDRA